MYILYTLPNAFRTRKSAAQSQSVHTASILENVVVLRNYDRQLVYYHITSLIIEWVFLYLMFFLEINSIN